MNVEQQLTEHNLDSLRQLERSQVSRWRVNKSGQTKLLIDTLRDPKKLSELVNQLAELEHFQRSHLVRDGCSALVPVRFMAQHKDLSLNIALTNAHDNTPQPRLRWNILPSAPSSSIL